MSKCHIVGNHVSRLNCVLTPFYANGMFTLSLIQLSQCGILYTLRVIRYNFQKVFLSPKIDSV